MRGAPSGPRRSAVRRSIALAVAGLGLAGAAVVRAQPTPAGGELQVNSYTTGDQGTPVVTLDEQGGIAVAWRSYGSAGTDGSDASIQWRRFDAQGVPVGPDLQVNTTTGAAQFEPSAAFLPGSGFVVAWVSYATAGTDTDSTSIQAQRFDAAGAQVGDELQVNTLTSGRQALPDVAFDRTSGRFLVVWFDNSDRSIQARAFEADGQPAGDQFRVDDDGVSNHFNPAVAGSGGGEFVIAFEAQGTVEDSDYGIRARRFSATGTPLAAGFQVNTYTTGSQYAPNVDGDGQGGFVVVWGSNGSAGTDTDGWSVQAQRFDAQGDPVGGEFQVNTYTTGTQEYPVVGSDDRGHFIVAWQSNGSAGSDSSGTSIQSQRFDAQGDPVGGEFQVNASTTGNQRDTWLATDSQGNFVVVWASQATAGDDPGWSIQAQRYDDVFREGFEAGDWVRWSAAVP